MRKTFYILLLTACCSLSACKKGDPGIDGKVGAQGGPGVKGDKGDPGVPGGMAAMQTVTIKSTDWNSIDALDGYFDITPKYPDAGLEVFVQTGNTFLPLGYSTFVDGQVFISDEYYPTANGVDGFIRVFYAVIPNTPLPDTVTLKVISFPVTSIIDVKSHTNVADYKSLKTYLKLQ